MGLRIISGHGYVSASRRTETGAQIGQQIWRNGHRNVGHDLDDNVLYHGQRRDSRYHGDLWRGAGSGPLGYYGVPVGHDGWHAT